MTSETVLVKVTSLPKSSVRLHSSSSFPDSLKSITHLWRERSSDWHFSFNLRLFLHGYPCITVFPPSTRKKFNPLSSRTNLLLLLLLSSPTLTLVYSVLTALFLSVSSFPTGIFSCPQRVHPLNRIPLLSSSESDSIPFSFRESSIHSYICPRITSRSF